MRRLQLRLARVIVGCNARRHYFTVTAARQGYQERERRILGGFVERAALVRFRRNVGFATRFSPLKPKLLDSIMNVERVRGRSPEEIASCWDDVSDADHIHRLISCLFLAVPFFVRGASSNQFLNYLSRQVIPVFDKLPEERKLDLLKALAELSPYTTPQDARPFIPSIVELLKKYMPRRKIGEEMNFTYVECLLYALPHFAHKAPNATNSLCGYKSHLIGLEKTSLSITRT